MSNYSAINNYNIYLVENQLNINIIDYVNDDKYKIYFTNNVLKI